MVAAAGTLALRHWKRSTVHPEAHVQDMDIGQRVTVASWTGREGTVNYRGALWDAEAASASVDPDKPLVIRAIKGNVLVLGNN